MGHLHAQAPELVLELFAVALEGVKKLIKTLGVYHNISNSIPTQSWAVGSRGNSLTHSNVAMLSTSAAHCTWPSSVASLLHPALQ